MRAWFSIIFFIPSTELKCKRKRSALHSAVLRRVARITSAALERRRPQARQDGGEKLPSAAAHTACIPANFPSPRQCLILLTFMRQQPCPRFIHPTHASLKLKPGAFIQSGRVGFVQTTGARMAVLEPSDGSMLMAARPSIPHHQSLGRDLQRCPRSIDHTLLLFFS
ncbi:hypothetical protein FHG87_000310 [Trinorchestia longiramus]|nr:hypothetical protein FHG87_000310 [Trinorchestia longiramus]